MTAFHESYFKWILKWDNCFWSLDWSSSRESFGNHRFLNMKFFPYRFVDEQWKKNFVHRSMCFGVRFSVYACISMLHIHILTSLYLIPIYCAIYVCMYACMHQNSYTIWKFLCAHSIPQNHFNSFPKHTHTHAPHSHPYEWLCQPACLHACLLVNQPAS